MKRFLIALAALAALAIGTASADTTRYLDAVNGNDNWDGTASTNTAGTNAGPWKSLPKAMTRLPQPNSTNGTVKLLIAPGFYQGTISPDSSSTGPAYATYIYGTNASWSVINAGYSDKTIQVGSTGDGIAVLKAKRVRYANLNFNSNVTLDSLALAVCIDSSLIARSINFHGPDSCCIRNTTTNGNSLVLMDATGDNTYYHPNFWTEADTLWNVTAPNLGKSSASGGQEKLFRVWEDHTAHNLGVYGPRVKRFVARDCNMTFTNVPGGNDQGIAMCAIDSSSFVGNHWNFIDNNTNSIPTACIQLRYYNKGLSFSRDTMTMTGQGRMTTLWNQVSDGDSLGSMNHTHIDSCFIRATGMASAPLCFISMMSPGDSITYTTVVASGTPALQVNGMAMGPCYINHNTFVSDYRPVEFTMEGSSTWRGTTTFKNNIVYRIASGSVATPCAGVYTPLSQGGPIAALTINKLIDAGGATAKTKFASDYNLLTCFAYITPTRYNEASVAWYDSTQSGNSQSGVGSSAKGCFDANWYNSTAGNDSHSRSGSPMFGLGGPDSTLGSFDPRLGYGSQAYASGESGSDIGAVAYTILPSARCTRSNLRIDLNGGTSGTDTLTVYNVGAGTLRVLGTSVAGTTGGSVSPATATIASGGTATFTLTYSKTLVTPPGGSEPSFFVYITTDDKLNQTFVLPVAVSGRTSTDQQ